MDPAVGFELMAVSGDRVRAGDPIVIVHANASDDVAAVRPMLEQAITFADAPPPARPLILDRLGLARDA